MNIRILWLGKDSLFHGWRDPVMRTLGGVPVDRDAAGDVVAELTDRIDAGSVFGLVITPDGTRGPHTYWKSGFYRLAERTGMPVTLGYVDRRTMTTGLGPTFSVTGDVVADMDRIRDFYRDKSGFLPEARVEPRLRRESELR